MTGPAPGRRGLPRLRAVVPRLVHFVFLQPPDGAPYPFDCFKYASVVAALRHVRPEAVMLHGNRVPEGFWWQRAVAAVQAAGAALVFAARALEDPGTAFGRPLSYIQHRADVLRLRALHEHGGVYLDLDVLLLRSLTPLLRHDCTLAAEATFGICNAVILARPGAAFLKRWCEGYRDYRPDSWEHNNMCVPAGLARRAGRGEVNLLGQRAFFWPDFSREGLALLYESHTPGLWRHAYGVHLWENNVRGYLRSYAVEPARLHRETPTNFTALAASLIPEALVAEWERQASTA